jgi:hypothetical protein
MRAGVARNEAGDPVLFIFKNKLGKTKRELIGEYFKITLQDGRVVQPSDLERYLTLFVRDSKKSEDASRKSETFDGREFTLMYRDPKGAYSADWSMLVRDGSNYARIFVTIKALTEDLPLKNICLIDVPLAEAKEMGSVPGSPVVCDNLFFGFENPLSKNVVENGHVICSLDRATPLKKGQTVTYSAVIGVTPDGQLRRGFLNYLERERAHPYRPFLHYNSWYDIGFGNPFDEKAALESIESFGQELVKKRGVKLDSFLFDDGWDDPKTLWGFNSGFLLGFRDVRKATEKYGAEPGVWMSPWGGYGSAHDQRIKYGKEQGFEIVNNGFALSGPVYYKRFEETCLKMIRDYGVNQFKFDGTGNVNSVIPGSAFGSDFEAMIALIERLREEKPDLFVNLTTGTWPSPFWTRYADSIWRSSADHSFAGVGPDRQQWITYRDGHTYQNVVLRGPLYPLTSLMLHGLLYAKSGNRLNTDPTNAFVDEVRSYFGSGTQLQEMYLTASLLSEKNWDDIAEAAQWSRANASVFVDTHWVGGNPLQLEVYGWAAWTPKKAVLTLRNPSDKPQSIAIDVAKVFELPKGAAKKYVGKSPWKADKDKPTVAFEAGKETVIELKPFEVVNLDVVGK